MLLASGLHSSKSASNNRADRGSLLVALAPELVGRGFRVLATARLATAPAVVLADSAPLYSRTNVLRFPLRQLPPTLETNVTLTLQISPGPLEISLTRRLSRHVPPAGQKAVVVDHHTRSLRVDGTPWQGSGWYIFSGWLCDGHANAPPFDWAPGNGAGSFIDQINQLASAGFKQFVVYDINKIICGGAVNEVTFGVF